VKGPRRFLVALALVACGAGACVALAGGAGATLTPPASGDWTIDLGESPTLSGGTTVVVGNITVNGTLTLDNEILELQAPAAGVLPWILVNGQGQLALDNATLQAGPGPSARFVLDASPGAQVSARSTAFMRLAATSAGNLSLVGAHLRGATVQLIDCRVTDSDGGLGFDEGASLDAVNLSVDVRARALVLGEGTVAGLRDSRFSGSKAATDFLVVVDRATIFALDSAFENASTLVLLLSAAGTFTGATLTQAAQTAVLLVGSDLTVAGGLIAPRSDGALGVEAYASRVTATAAFQNYSLGISALGSTVVVANSTFASSNATPKGGFAGIYGFDSDLWVNDTSFNGTYLLTTVPGPGGPTDVLSCSNSALWVVRSRASLRALVSSCYSEHYHADESDSTVDGFSMENGSLGANFQHGTVEAADGDAGLGQASLRVGGACAALVGVPHQAVEGGGDIGEGGDGAKGPGRQALGHDRVAAAKEAKARRGTQGLQRVGQFVLRVLHAKESPRVKLAQVQHGFIGHGHAGHLRDVVGQQLPMLRHGLPKDGVKVGDQSLGAEVLVVEGREGDDAVHAQVEGGAGEGDGIGQAGAAGTGQKLEAGVRGGAVGQAGADDGQALVHREGGAFAGGAEQEHAVAAARGEEIEQGGQGVQVWGEGGGEGGDGRGKDAAQG